MKYFKPTSTLVVGVLIGWLVVPKITGRLGGA